MSPPAPAAAPPCVLAFDTATERMAVALQAPTGPRVLDAPGGAAASATLLPQVQRLLAEAGLTPAALRFIAFGSGPGAFTGLRTACAVAQGLGYGLNCPLLPICSLLIVAEDARAQAGGGEGFSVGVAVDARMNETYAAAYRWQGGRWQVLQAPALYTLPSLNAAWQGLALQALAGNAWAAFTGQLQTPTGATLWPQETGRAAALLRLALQAAAAGEGLPADAALPLYLRDKVALTTAERAAAHPATATAAS
jgi:tRNA threonylcarbamoyladenosine biosynthesis protein TsaB